MVICLAEMIGLWFNHCDITTQAALTVSIWFFYVYEKIQFARFPSVSYGNKIGFIFFVITT